MDYLLPAYYALLVVTVVLRPLLHLFTKPIWVDVYKDFAHIAVGIALGGWFVSYREDLTYGISFYGFTALALTFWECLCFGLTRAGILPGPPKR